MTVLESSSLIASSNVRSWKTGTSASTSRTPASNRGREIGWTRRPHDECHGPRRLLRERQVHVRVGQQLDIGGRVAGADDANPLGCLAPPAIGARRAPRRSTKYFCAAVVLMIATGSVSLRSPFVKARPARTGRPMVEEVGADDEAPAQGRSASFAGGRPLTTKVWRAPTASAGSALVAAAASTPVRAGVASSASCRRATALSSRCFHSGVTICAVSRGCGSKPMSTRLIAIIDRTTSVATTRASSPMRPARTSA